MSGSDPSRAPAPGLFIPFLLLAASLLVFLVWQIFIVQERRAGLATAKAQLAEAIQNRELQVAQSLEIKNRLQALATDLLALSQTDEKARAIVKKYNIQQALPAAAAEAGK